MDLTMCGLLASRAEELAALYGEHGTWNDVETVWFEQRRANRSTTGSARKIYRVLSARFKNAPVGLPNPRDLPDVLDACSSSRDKAQVLYLYLVADDALVRYTVGEYARRLDGGHPEPLEFSDETLTAILEGIEYADGSSFDYAESTTQRWCEGFRSVMREIGALEGGQAVVGAPPSLGETPLLVATGYSHEAGGDEWVGSPRGYRDLLQPSARWEELYDRAAGTEAWEFVELQGGLQLRPVDGVYASFTTREAG